MFITKDCNIYTAFQVRKFIALCYYVAGSPQMFRLENCQQTVLCCDVTDLCSCPMGQCDAGI